MAKASATPAWQRAVVVLTGTVVAVVVVGFLYWAQKVLVPVALAVFLTFLLAPPVTMLQRRGLGRTPAVIVVVLAAALLLAGVVCVVAVEVKSLAGELPTYSKNIKERLKSLREMGQGTGGLDSLVQDITGDWESRPAGPEEETREKPPGQLGTAPVKPSTLVLQPERPAWQSWLQTVLTPVAELLGGLAMALVLVVFMLLKRENLRNRLIRLVGHGRMTVTTKALDDAGHRISRSLLVQLIMNGSFGLVLGIGLFAIGLPHALLWGFLAAVLRYVPYLGTWVMVSVLVVLSLATFPGWVQPLLVVGLIVALELVTANVLEPRFFGQSMGVSEVALLVAAAFWAFLWGPIGLVLSSPLTVCLVVLGKYVPQVGFLNVLLGDEASSDTEVNYYQRLLARDQDEATQLVLAQAKSAPPEQVYDELLVPALNYVKRDRERDDLTEADEQFILRATREIVEDLGERQAAAAENAAAPAGDATRAPAPRQVRVLACPGHDGTDALALEMFRQLLDPTRWQVEVLSIDNLSAEMVALAGDKEPAVVCIGALPPGGLAHTRYLCKRLRARLPEARIVVGRWGLKGNVEQNLEQLREAGADQVETTLLETRNHLSAWLPVLAQQGEKTTVDGPAANGQRVAV